MLAIKSILLPVDFSAISASAARYAGVLTCRAQARLTVLHVIPWRPLSVNNTDVSLSSSLALENTWNELIHEQAVKEMAEFVKAHLYGVSPSTYVLKGDIARVIVQQAHDNNTDLLVMATHGFGGFRRMLIGSITAKVLNDVACPVFTSTHAESAPAVIPPVRTIICAVDFGPQSEAVIRWAGDFARLTGAELYLAHVLPRLPMGQWGYCETDLNGPLRNEAEHKGQLLLQAAGVDAPLLIANGPVVESLKDLANNHEADLLVIGRHHRESVFDRLRDTAYAIIRESPCPVVSV
jgi:nucleotide-binding universal stress UspA family protein